MTPSDALVLNFAVDVTDRLATVARGIGGSEDKLFCPALAAALWLVSQHMKDQKESDSVHIPRLLKLLNNLERICKVGQPRVLNHGRLITNSWYLAYNRPKSAKRTKK